MNESTPPVSNMPLRPPGRVLQVAQRVLPGVAAVQAQIRPYAAAWQRHNQAALKATGPLWVVFGDSMAQGIGASSFDKSWVGQLQAHLAAEGRQYRLVNLSISGARVQDVLDVQLPAVQRLGVTPQLVTVLIGSNDMLRAIYRRPLVARYHRLIAALPPGSFVASPLGDRGVGRQVNELLEAAAAAGTIRLLDTALGRNYHEWRGKLAADRFHPNDAGYAEIAAQYYTALKRASLAGRNKKPA